MPTRARVQELIARVEAGRILEAIEEYYADDVAMQENTAPPTVGKAANARREAAFLANVKDVHENRAVAFVVEGDRAVIHWIFDFTAQDGRRYRMEQVASQTWRGDHIVHERFYYDSASLAA